MEFNPFFKEYARLVSRVDQAFENVRRDHAGEVTCHLGCSDCCYALFDMSLVEAIYIKHQFDQKFSSTERTTILERANTADRAIYRLKKQAFNDHKNGKTEEQIIEEMAMRRVRCPLLDDQDQCLLYESRPITCRLYGIPTEIGGLAHTCGKNGFCRGQAYPTVKIESIHRRLYEISTALAQSINSRYLKLAEMLIPLSMALLTDYNEDYLGVDHNDTQKEDEV